MNRELLHTPDGVRDVYGEELERRMDALSSIRARMRDYGYREIKPPLFEFFDVFSKDLSGWSAKDLYKFFDKEGNTLVLRPDFTPQIARCVSKYFLEEDRAVRLCYEGDAYVNASELQGKLKETTQTGVELVNDETVAADAEMIALLIDCLRAGGLKDFQISVGHAAFFHGICMERGLDAAAEDEIRSLIAENNYFAAEKRMFDCGIEETYREMLLKIADFVGGADDLRRVEEKVKNEISRKAIGRLRAVYDAIKDETARSRVSFDFGMLTKNNYYTGVTFEAYAYGVGDAIAKGGRYDDLLKRFGKDAPAIGFMIVVDDLMSALTRQAT